ncbi:nuclear transport factor 2 family protein [Erythrobacter sp. F6033]|uniref:nuclear transport factor 2 family protein n=1 Tax=Erythrobacter sp. F6033 TaxID=2926401 RepID=UPI001FF68F97|nr:nuclear transport factor 2 family protein [Erythrobacter sp. F6033]MCK0127247.1 nuclear transport factor 2 family protein [Erythrobacter sp. F6033]
MFKRMPKNLGFVAGAFLLASQAALAEQTPPSELQVAEDYVEAYNQRNLDAMLALMHQDVQWLSVEGSEVAVFANGKTDLKEQMRDYLASPLATRSTIDGSVTDGRFVAVREIAMWTTSDGEERSQSALAVYEIENGLVRRVWYYPATR